MATASLNIISYDATALYEAFSLKKPVIVIFSHKEYSLLNENVKEIFDRLIPYKITYIASKNVKIDLSMARLNFKLKVVRKLISLWRESL